MVHRTARRLESALRGRPLVSALTPSPRARPDVTAARLVGRSLERAEARGKHLLLRFGADAIIHSHLGMRGSWQVYPRGGTWRRPVASAWLVLSTDRHDAVQFGGSRLALLDEAAVRRHRQLASLGPDLLDPAFAPELGADAIRGGAPESELGEALLDQRLVSGIGNIYKSEGCFAAGVSPWHAVAALDRDDLIEVVAGTRTLMRRAMDGGSRDRAVYKRAGRACPRCGRPIRSRAQGDAARTTYWCEGCQR